MSRQLKIVSITNIVLEPYYSKFLAQDFGELNIEVSLSSIGFEECGSGSGSEKISEADLIFVAINFETLFPDYPESGGHPEILTENCFVELEKLYASLKSDRRKQILLLSFEDYYMQQSMVIGNILPQENVIDAINRKFFDMVAGDDVILDLKRLIARVGISRAFDLKGKYRWNALYSKELIREICREIWKQYKISNGLTPKCVAVDCDNVLWGGILSEDGIEKIRISESGSGKQYRDFQRFLLYLYNHGVLITVCSKNDEQDVRQVFRQHSGMVLKEEHIACFRVNWNNKPENIRRISEELNIDLESIVFIDDSPYEVNEVSGKLPEVYTILYGRDTIFQDLECFSLKWEVDLEKIRIRNETFRTNLERNRLKEKAGTEQEYLRALKMKVDIHKTLGSELSRVSELSQRTNKCTNGVRYTVEELREFMENPEYQMRSVYLSDCFSDLGLVGVIGIENGKIDLFSLSCRALGRNIEKDMIKYAVKAGAKSVTVNKTEKNEELVRLFDILGLSGDKGSGRNDR